MQSAESLTQRIQCAELSCEHARGSLYDAGCPHGEYVPVAGRGGKLSAELVWTGWRVVFTSARESSEALRFPLCCATAKGCTL